MSLNKQVDVVVIGFGVAGAAASLAAAGAGAQVLVLDQGVPSGHGWSASRRIRSRAALRSAARAAGVEIRPLCRAHELVMEADRVRGVGFAALPDRRRTAVASRMLDRVGDLGAGPATRAVAAATDRLWESGFRVEEVACASVILAMDPRHWDFVGPATATVSRSLRRVQLFSPARRTRHLRLVGADEVAVGSTPELSVRLWCGESGAAGPVRRSGLHVDGTTGAVWVGGESVGDELAVPGLYAAVPVGVSTRVDDAGSTHTPSGAEPGCPAALAAGLHAGRQAAGAAVAAPWAESALLEATSVLPGR